MLAEVPLALTEENTSHELVDILMESSYTLIDFSGSWCKPCQVILPKLQSMYKRYGNQVKFVTIAVEDDFSTAEKFHKQTGSQWKMIYENINCRSGNCLKNIFATSGYPTLVLIDKDKKVLFNEAGTDAVNGVEKVIKSLIK